MTTQKSTRRHDNIVPVRGKKGTTYKVLIRRKGHRTIAKTFPTLAKAKAFRDDLKGSRDKLAMYGGDGSRMLLRDMIDRYAREYTGRDATVPAKLEYWDERLGHWRLSEITRQPVAEELDRLRNEPARKPIRGGESREAARPRKQATVNRYLSTLSQVFALAIEKNLIDSNPCEGIKRGGETSRFGRALTDEERTALLEACKASEYDRLYMLVSLALTTGARLGELMSLTWNDLDLKNAVAKLSATKNGNPRHLPLIPMVLEQLQVLPRPIDRTERLFPSDIDRHKHYRAGFRKHWDKALQDAGISNFRFHDLRHSAASMLTEAGIPLVTVAEILGHRTMQMVQRYSHVHTAQKAKVVTEVFGDLLG